MTTLWDAMLETAEMDAIISEIKDAENMEVSSYTAPTGPFGLSFADENIGY